MHLSVIATNEANVESQDLYRESRKRGIDTTMFFLSDLTVGVGLGVVPSSGDARAGAGGPVSFVAGRPGATVDLGNLDGAFVRGVGAAEVNFTRIFFRMDGLYALERSGVKVLNPPRGIEVATDKFLTSVILSQSGIPTPRTVVAETFENALAGFRELGEDVVLKPIYGSMGYGVTRLTDRGFAEYVFSTLEQHNETFYLQEFLEHHRRDVRLFVLDGSVVASMYRENPEPTGDSGGRYSWKTNIHAGAKPRAYDPPEELKELAVKATEAVGLEVAGVDVLETRDGFKVIEVNSIPGWRALQRVVPVDVPALVVDYMVNSVKN
ncbi:MAG: RimK family alpha-L-glutamate ligase [Promethearchaeota archaeon]